MGGEERGEGAEEGRRGRGGEKRRGGEIVCWGLHEDDKRMG